MSPMFARPLSHAMSMLLPGGQPALLLVVVLALGTSTCIAAQSPTNTSAPGLELDRRELVGGNVVGGLGNQTPTAAPSSYFEASLAVRGGGGGSTDGEEKEREVLAFTGIIFAGIAVSCGLVCACCALFYMDFGNHESEGAGTTVTEYAQTKAARRAKPRVIVSKGVGFNLNEWDDVRQVSSDTTNNPKIFLGPTIHPKHDSAIVWPSNFGPQGYGPFNTMLEVSGIPGTDGFLSLDAVACDCGPTSTEWAGLKNKQGQTLPMTDVKAMLWHHGQRWTACYGNLVSAPVPTGVCTPFGPCLSWPPQGASVSLRCCAGLPHP